MSDKTSVRQNLRTYVSLRRFTGNFIRGVSPTKQNLGIRRLNQTSFGAKLYSFLGVKPVTSRLHRKHILHVTRFIYVLLPGIKNLYNGRPQGLLPFSNTLNLNFL